MFTKKVYLKQSYVTPKMAVYYKVTRERGLCHTLQCTVNHNDIDLHVLLEQILPIKNKLWPSRIWCKWKKAIRNSSKQLPCLPSSIHPYLSLEGERIVRQLTRTNTLTTIQIAFFQIRERWKLNKRNFMHGRNNVFISTIFFSSTRNRAIDRRNYSKCWW